jgi:aspartate/methionine/tyrosine aminotransferase
MNSSPYLEHMKLAKPARFNLSGSGVLGLPLSELPVSLGDLEINGSPGYGYPPLIERLAARFRVPPACVVCATGTSMALHLAMAALLEPGDEVLVEKPAYDVLYAVPQYLGAEVKRFIRRPEDGYALPLAEIARQLSSQTRLIVLSNLHNPTCALTDETALRTVGELARQVGARVLVNEVYLDACFTGRPQTAFTLGDPFLSVSSLTKVYGLGGLRCGWILAEPALARRIWRLGDLFENNFPHVAERLSVIALDHLAPLAERAQRILDTNRRSLHEVLGGRSDLEWHFPAVGTTAFPKLKGGRVLEFCARLREHFETAVVPGHFFERPDHIRIGLGGDPAATRTGLERIAEALDTHGRPPA